MTTDAIRRLILDALSHGDDHDAFRTRLRAALRAVDADDDPPPIVRPAPPAARPLSPLPQTSA